MSDTIQTRQNDPQKNLRSKPFFMWSNEENGGWCSSPVNMMITMVSMIMLIMMISMIMIIMMMACDDQVWCFFAATPANSVSVWGGDGGKTSGNQHKPRWNTLKRKTLFWKGSPLEKLGPYMDFFYFWDLTVLHCWQILIFTSFRNSGKNIV